MQATYCIKLLYYCLNYCIFSSFVAVNMLNYLDSKGDSLLVPADLCDGGDGQLYLALVHSGHDGEDDLLAAVGIDL